MCGCVLCFLGCRLARARARVRCSPAHTDVPAPRARAPVIVGLLVDGGVDLGGDDGLLAAGGEDGALEGESNV